MQERIENLIQGPLKSYLEGNTNVTADERTNQIILITHPGNLEIIMDVIQSVDVDAAPLTQQVSSSVKLKPKKLSPSSKT